MIPERIRNLCEAMVKHITYVSYETFHINRMVAFFKVDIKENIWFLWASSIRAVEVVFFDEIKLKLIV